MQITINIPDDQAAQIMDGVCAATNYDPKTSKDKIEWTKDKLVSWLKDNAKRGQLMNLRTSIVTAVDNINISFDVADAQ